VELLEDEDEDEEAAEDEETAEEDEEDEVELRESEVESVLVSSFSSKPIKLSNLTTFFSSHSFSNTNPQRCYV